DTRGSYNTTTPANYGIIKAKDNNCWMTDNLNLYNRTVSYIDTDIPSGSYTISNTSSWTGNTYNTSKVHRATNSGYTDQVYYNWCSAVGLTTTCNTTEQQDRSICPKGWNLPIKSKYTKLFNSYNITTATSLLNTIALGYKKYYGYYSIDTQEEILQGSSSAFWYSSPYTNTHANGLIYTKDTDLIDVTDYSRKDLGISIRCLAR
ncbi:hypothetical protein IKG16_01030, partial [Candidatus Saccharibacteria bacterium]|nr:hypothetical protein [Candidatus Saccharibacteria bacterium]